ncbi:MAG: hypothetical protein JSU66_06450 [Deltaproteobacteria bacterium]|nr:MAG: hypothetical protein JSU66_06450 [Deltaproteobacteria bacterium]
MPVDRRALLLSLPLFLLPAEAAVTEALDLGNSQPRWIEVEFEVSPRDRPGQLDAIYTEPLPARLEPGAAERQRRVVISRDIVEQRLFGAERPVAGSFSDFVWTFDADTGHVESAVVSGKLTPTVGWGLFSKRITADIRVHMTTRTRAGFSGPRRRFGALIFEYCSEPDAPACTLIGAARYEPTSGYVNAVGELVAHSAGLRTRSFSPLGEARFSERPRPAVLSASQALDAPRPR